MIFNSIEHSYFSNGVYRVLGPHTSFSSLSDQLDDGVFGRLWFNQDTRSFKKLSSIFRCFPSMKNTVYIINRIWFPTKCYTYVDIFGSKIILKIANLFFIIILRIYWYSYLMKSYVFISLYLQCLPCNSWHFLICLRDLVFNFHFPISSLFLWNK